MVRRIQPELGRYAELLQRFDGTLESIPDDTQLEVIQLFAEEGREGLEARRDIPGEIIDAVLAQPDLMQKALALRSGEFALRFVNEVLPAAITLAATGGAGSVQAAKLVAEVIGATQGRKPVGRPPEEKPEKGPTLEEKLTKLTQSASEKKAAAPSKRSLPRKK